MHTFFGVGFLDSLILNGSDNFELKGVFNSPATQALDRMKVVVYVTGDSANTYQELTFAAIQCDDPNQNIILNPTGSYCSTDSVFLSVQGSYFNYQWSTGQTSSTIHVQASTNVTIQAEDNLGCLAVDTADIDVSIPFDEQICIVSVDSVTGKNIVVWEKTPLMKTDQFYIYKESFQAGVYNLIGFVDYDSLSVFVDLSSNPLQQSERYKISAVDSCGTESAKSSDHKTIHLTASVGTSNENNLVWDGYEGFTFPTYNIYRGANPSSMSLLAQVASSAFTYSDLTPLAGNNYYKIEAVRPSPCTPTQKTTTYVSSISNFVSLNPNGIDDYNSVDVSIYPNPIKDKLSLQFQYTYSKINVNVYSVVGNQVMSNSFVGTNKVEMNFDQTAGVYLVQIELDNKLIITKRVIKE